jgi:hypothetical protein
MTEEERLQRRSAEILYLRHCLQKGFLSSGPAPKPEDMPRMSELLGLLEQCKGHEAESIFKSKVCKVLKRVIELDFIPGDERYLFKQRANDLLRWWKRVLAVDRDHTTPIEPLIIGVKHHDKVMSPVESNEIEAKQDNRHSLPSVRNPSPIASMSTTLPEDRDRILCQKCPARFTGPHRSGNLNRHTRVNHGEKKGSLAR